MNPLQVIPILSILWAIPINLKGGTAPHAAQDMPSALTKRTGREKLERLFSGFPHLQADPSVASDRKSTGLAFSTGVELGYGWADRSSSFIILKRRAADSLKTHHLPMEILKCCAVYT